MLGTTRLVGNQSRGRQMHELLKQLEAAKQRELELLAVIDEQNKFLERCINDEFGVSDKYLRKEIEERYITPTQILREHEAKVLEEAAEWFDNEEYVVMSDDMSSAEDYAENQLRRMAEERRKK